MVNIIEIKAIKREKAGKGASRAIRRTGYVPTVVYGDKKAPVLCSIEEKILTTLLNKTGFWTHQFEIDVDGEKSRTVCQDIQFHPVSDRPIHADFLRISKNAKLVMDIPLRFIHEDVAPGIKDGGVLNVVHRSLEVSCSPDNIPEYLELDLSALSIGDGLTTKDIVLPKDVKLVEEEEITVVTIAEPVEEEVEETSTPTAGESSTTAEEPKAEEEGK